MGSRRSTGECPPTAEFFVKISPGSVNRATVTATGVGVMAVDEMPKGRNVNPLVATDGDLIKVRGPGNVSGTLEEAANNQRLLNQACTALNVDDNKTVVNMSAKGAGAVVRSTTLLRDLANQMGVNPVQVLLFYSAGYRPKLKPVKVMLPGGGFRIQFEMGLEPDGSVKLEEVTSAEQLVAAKEAGKFIYPHLKATNMTPDDVGDKKAQTLAELLLGLRPGESATVTRNYDADVAEIEGGEGDEEY